MDLKSKNFPVTQNRSVGNMSASVPTHQRQPIINFSKMIPLRKPIDFRVQPSDLYPPKSNASTVTSTTPASTSSSMAMNFPKVGTIGRRTFPPPEPLNKYELHRYRMKKSEELIGKTMSHAAKSLIGSTDPEVWDESRESDPFELRHVLDTTATVGHRNDPLSGSPERTEIGNTKSKKLSTADAFFERLIRNPLLDVRRDDGSGDGENMIDSHKIIHKAREPRFYKLHKDFEPINGVTDMVVVGGHLHSATNERKTVPNTFAKPEVFNVHSESAAVVELPSPSAILGTMPRNETPQFRHEVNVDGFLNTDIQFQSTENAIIVTGLRNKDSRQNARKVVEIIDLPPQVYPQDIRVAKIGKGPLIFTKH